MEYPFRASVVINHNVTVMIDAGKSRKKRDTFTLLR